MTSTFTTRKKKPLKTVVPFLKKIFPLLTTIKVTIVKQYYTHTGYMQYIMNMNQIKKRDQQQFKLSLEGTGNLRTPEDHSFAVNCGLRNLRVP